MGGTLQMLGMTLIGSTKTFKTSKSAVLGGIMYLGGHISRS
jgi:hypothetical protein